ncbi:MAG: GH32 C-terminal domain-containing protein [Dorea sp.]
MTVEFTDEITGEFSIDVAHNEMYTTTFTYDGEKHLLEIDRTYSGVDADVVCTRKIEIADKNNAPKLHFIMDRYSVEVFINDGEQVASTVVPTPVEADQILFTSDKECVVNIQKYEIEI